MMTMSNGQLCGPHALHVASSDYDMAHYDEGSPPFTTTSHGAAVLQVAAHVGAPFAAAALFLVSSLVQSRPEVRSCEVMCVATATVDSDASSSQMTHSLRRQRRGMVRRRRFERIGGAERQSAPDRSGAEDASRTGAAPRTTRRWRGRGAAATEQSSGPRGGADDGLGPRHRGRPWIDPLRERTSSPPRRRPSRRVVAVALVRPASGAWWCVVGWGSARARHHRAPPRGGGGGGGGGRRQEVEGGGDGGRQAGGGRDVRPFQA